MRATKILYWSTTIFTALMMVYSTWAYLSDPLVVQTFGHLGFPAYFRIELAVAKLIGAVLLVTPIGARIKEWAYAGFAICFVSAFIAHTATGDSISERVMPLIFLVLLFASYFTRNTLQRVRVTAAAA